VNQTVLNHGPIETNFTHAHLKNAFGGVLRHLVIGGEDLHADKDSRKVSILTDDERPLVTYGGKRQFARSKGLKND
jgi:manganese/iron transport system ATP-binding protein